MEKLLNPTGMPPRGTDAHGSGAFLASRVNRLHYGVDLECAPGQEIAAPCIGTILRRKRPYASDPFWDGLLIVSDEGLLITLFYMEPLTGILGTTVSRGRIIGEAQDISKKYRGITPHVHMEVVWPKDRTLPLDWRLGYEYVIRNGANRGIYVDPTRLMGE